MKFATLLTGALRITPDPELLQMAARRAIGKLPDHVGVLHKYVDRTLGLEETLRVQMEKMSCEQFERVLHPIFEEDELTLVLAGGALGFAAGLIQQGLETGKLKVPRPRHVWGFLIGFPQQLRSLSPRQVVGRAMGRIRRLVPSKHASSKLEDQPKTHKNDLPESEDPT